MNEMTLYEVTGTLLDILEGWERIDEETGEIIYDTSDIDALAMTLKDKVEGCAYAIANKQSTLDALTVEIKVLQERKRRLKNGLDRLKAYVADNIAAIDGRMELPIMSLSVRDTEAVEIYDIDKVPEEYKRVKVEVIPDKKAIHKAINDGETVDGAALVINRNLVVRR